MDNFLWEVSLFLVSSLWAISMGASGFSVSFATLYSTKRVGLLMCMLLFTVFLLIGAVFVGGEVAKTLSSKIIPKEVLSTKKWLVVIILFSAGINLFVSNLLRVPSSTSMIIMTSFLGAGLYLWNVYWDTFILSLVVFVSSFVLTYFSTFFLTKLLYPPRYSNLWVYEKLLNKKEFLFILVLATSIYNAFSIGTNNVSNVVGPVIATDIMGEFEGFVLFSLLFGLGALLMGKRVIKTVGDEIVPLGVVSASIVSIVSSTFTILSSLIGLPFPTVIVVASSIIAVSTVKKEISHLYSLKSPLTKKILIVWGFSTSLPTVTTYLMCHLFSSLGLI